jgi:thiamine-phosphate pyrophosphorylase
MKLIVISSSKNSADDSKIMTELFENGLGTFHLRKPTMSTKDMSSLIDSVPEHFRDRIVLHSHHKLVSKYNLRGVHLTGVHRRRKFSTWFRLKMLRMKIDNLTVSTSFHKLAHVYTNKEVYDYLFLGTIFDRLSNKYHAGYSEHNIRAVIQKSSIPLIARGGTSADVISLCADLKFAGIAFSSAIWDTDSPIQSWAKILNTCKEQSIPVE